MNELVHLPFAMFLEACSQKHVQRATDFVIPNHGNQDVEIDPFTRFPACEARLLSGMGHGFHDGWRSLV